MKVSDSSIYKVQPISPIYAADNNSQPKRYYSMPNLPILEEDYQTRESNSRGGFIIDFLA